jgi:signal transduction histidine kinase
MRTSARSGGTVRAVRELVARPIRVDLLLAAGLTAAGLLEALLGPADDRLVRTLTLPLATVPLAWRRRAPLLALAAVAVVLLLQSTLGDFFVAQPATPLVAMVIALYTAGRYAAGAWALVAAALVAATLVAIRVVFDPVVDAPPEALLTAVGVGIPLLAGRWLAGQARLQRELEREAEEREQARARDARHAAEEERMRIAADLEAAVAVRLDEVMRLTPALREHIAAEEAVAARALLQRVADASREALADVRRVLGVLRRDGEEPQRAPQRRTPAPDAGAPAPDPGAPANGVAVANVAAPSAAGVAVAHVTAAPAEAGGTVMRRDDPPGVDWLGRVLAAAVLVGAQVEFALRESGGDHLAGALTAVAVAAPLLWRRRRPVAAALAILAAVALQSVLLRPQYFPAADGAALVCAAYAIGAYANRRDAIVGIGVLAIGEAAHALAFHPQAVAIAVFAAAAVPWTIGRIARAQRLLTQTVRARAAEVERSRALEARAAVTAERMRVARELHDAVAHSLSVMAIQAAGADGIVERDPARAAECAELIEAVGRDAIAELGRLSGAPEGDPPPSLARLDALAQRARAAGLPVEVRVEGNLARLPAGVDLAGFRIVQEALANVAKHAGRARARVVVRHEGRALELEIDDDGRGPGATIHGTGHGLVGMRERAALYGGTLDAGPRPSGGFAVRARLPLEHS